MDDAGEILHEVGTFEPRLARRVLDALESEGISCEVEADHSALDDPTRAVKLYLAMNPEGSKVRIFVLESALARATARVAALFGEPPTG